MIRRPGQTVEVDSLEEFDRLVAGGAGSMSGWRLQNLDLRERTDALQGLHPGGALLLGCAIVDGTAEWLTQRGALVFPDIPDLPFDPYRGGLYTPGELYEGLETLGYHRTADAQIYAWSRQQVSAVAHPVARALHDHSIDAALDEALENRRCVGVMGGHALQRNDAEYAAAAALGRELARGGRYVATGGGPGAMEAANLGAYLAGADDTAIDEAVSLMTSSPNFRPSVTRWARTAFAVRDRWPGGQASLGIPTWCYGHEPPNVFASDIAKYFQNALREQTLLSRCDAGIIFLPGAAGTVQEIFQDACENYYADAAVVAPMILVGVRHWTETVPAWPLLQSLASSRSMSDHVHLVDSGPEAISLLAEQSSTSPIIAAEGDSVDERDDSRSRR